MSEALVCAELCRAVLCFVCGLWFVVCDLEDGETQGGLGGRPFLIQAQQRPG